MRERRYFHLFPGVDGHITGCSQEKDDNAARENIFGFIAFRSLAINGKALFLREYPIH